MKRIPLDAKISAYNEVIDFLALQESDSDTDYDRAARKWLADKLDRECDRLAGRREAAERGRTPAGG